MLRESDLYLPKKAWPARRLSPMRSPAVVALGRGTHQPGQTLIELTRATAQ